jgi:hypothetical protein
MYNILKKQHKNITREIGNKKVTGLNGSKNGLLVLKNIKILQLKLMLQILEFLNGGLYLMNVKKEVQPSKFQNLKITHLFSQVTLF